MSFFVTLSMLVLVTILSFSPVSVLNPTVDDLLIIVQHVLGSYAVVVDLVVVVPLLFPYAAVVLRVFSFVSRRIVYPLIEKVVAPCVLLVLFVLVCATCDFCVRVCTMLATQGMELLAFLLLTPLRRFGQFYSRSVSSGTLGATVGNKMTTQSSSIESSPIQQTRAAGTSTLKKQPVVCPKPSAPSPRRQSVVPQITFTPEARAWEKAVIEAWFSALGSSDFHGTFERNMALLTSGKVAGRPAGAKSA